MPVKIVFLSVGFLLSWLVLLPVLVIGGGTALFAGATLAEMADMITGASARRLDSHRAREIAGRMCGVPAQAFSRR